MIGLNRLPKGWAGAEVRELVDLVNGYAFRPSQWSKTGLPIIRIQNLNNPDAIFNHFEGGLPEKFLVQPGDLLFAWSGTPGTSFGAHVWRGQHAWLNQHIFKVQFDETHLDKRFLRLAINWNLEDYIAAAHGGAGLAHITKGVFEQSELLIPPLFEQRRIVAAIETQFTRLDASVAALERARANLKRYRAAVLKAACEGRLVPTEAEVARAEGRGYEAASVLLERIAAERDGVGAHGGAPAVDGGRRGNRSRAHGRAPLQMTDELPSLPEGWSWVRLESLLAEPLRNGHSAKASNDGRGVRTLTLTAVTMGDFSERNTKLTVAEPSKVTDLWLQPGDILVERSNTPELVGTARLFRGSKDFAIFPDLLIRARVHSSALGQYIEIALRSERGRRFLQSRAQGISGSMPKIDQGTVESVPIPFPPLAEQHRIVAEVERRLSVVEEMEGRLGRI